MPSPSPRTPAAAVLFQVVGWTLASALFALIRYVGLESVPGLERLDFGPGSGRAMASRLVVFGALLGLLFWAIDRATLGGRRRSWPYGRLVLLQTALRIAVLLFILALLRLRHFTEEGRGIDPGEWFALVFNLNTAVVLAYGGVVSAVFALIREADRHLGPGNLLRLLRGRYYEPREEERIFMFLDLQGSTGLAERLGHVRYSRFIQDCFGDLAVVAADRAEIYQYVGDEAVLTWPAQSGLQDAACLRAFGRFRERLLERREHYESEYGELPVFKAALNLGTVTVAEVGELKREIAYHGDVLNTAARAQAQCNALGEELIVTERLRSRLPEQPGLEFRPIGEIELRGKSEVVALHGVRRPGNGP